MKRIFTFLLLVLFSCLTFAADLNPFAYKLTATYDKATNSVSIGYHLNAPALKVKIIIYQDEAMPATSQEFTTSAYTSAGAHTANLSLHGLAGGNYSYKIEVYGRGQASTVAFHKRTVLNSPFGIDIDNNMNSPWFGRTLVTQPTTKNNTLRGLFEYWPSYFTLGTTPANPYNGGVDNYYQGSQSWYYYSHATPLRVRIAQDGTGRIFTTACDVDMDTYLWYVDPANPNNWTSLITANQMKSIVSHPNLSKIHNISLDIRNDNGKINLLLLSGSIEYGNHSFTTGYIYSGKYVLPSNFPTSTSGEYIHVIDPNIDEGIIGPHSYIKSGLLPVAINSSSQFDKYGGYWYCGSSQATEKDPFDNVAYKDKTGIKHVTTNGDIKFTYHNDDEKLKRYWTGTGGFRYNHDFSQVLIANGYNKTARLYNVSQASATAHPTLSFVTELGTIFADASNYITDFAWDHANNIYVVLRNGSSGYGIYTYATKYNANTPFVTKTPNTFEILCDANVSYTLTTSVNDASMGTVSAGGKHVSCSQVTVTATPKAGYRFVNWTVNGVEVNGANPYTLYMTDDMEVCANFASAVYEVTWWNLFQNGEDITKPSLDGTRNARLWYLVMPYYNQNNGTAQDRGIKGVNGTEYDVVAFMYDYADDIMTDMSILGWLGEYIKSVVGTNNFSNSTTYSSWAKCMYAFINRVGYAKNENGAYTYTETDGYSPAGIIRGIKNFSSTSVANAGDPSKWRPWWTQIACKLNSVMNYSDDMPIAWETLPGPNGTTYDTYTTSLPTSESTILLNTPAWYKWNTGGANQLLAWREGGTNPINNRIVHHVDKSMALYATYVDKNLQENDPEPQNQYDAKNNDILSLLANGNYGATLHNVTVDRKFVGGMYNTICLPFDLPLSLLPAELKGADIRMFDGVTETFDESGDPVAVLNFITIQDYWANWNVAHPDKQVAEENQYIEAGKPYLIKPAKDVNAAYLTYSNLAYWRFFDGTRTAYGESAGGVVFQGIFNPTTLSPGDCILVADNRLAKVTNTSEKLKGFRAYFKIEDAYLQSLADDGRLYLSMNKPVTSSVPVAPEAEQQTKPDVRKVMIDGKIYIIRGEEVYTINGMRVK